MSDTASVTRQKFSYPGILQFLFLLTWVTYVLYLGDFLGKLGLAKSFLPWLLILDQILFILADVIMGFFSSKFFQLHRRIGPLLLVLNLASCLIFIALPHLAATTPELFIGMTIIWVLSSSVLRVPLFGLIAQRTANPLHGTAGALLGMGIASALAPYLVYLLKGVDPALPFTLAGITLALATLGFLQWESTQTQTPRQPPYTKPSPGGLLRLLLPVLLLAAGFQLHAFTNSALLFKQVAEPGMLQWLLPVFWISFSLAVFPGAKLIDRWGAEKIFHSSATAGSIALALCLLNPPLALLLLLQLVAGLAWGGIFISGLAIAAQLGASGKEAFFTGAIFVLLALATIARILLNLPGLPVQLPDTLQLAALLWLGGSLAGVLLLRNMKRVQP